MSLERVDPEWVGGEVEKYQKIRPAYVEFCGLLERALKGAAGELAPEAIVQTRAKTVPSVAGKIIRQRVPVDELTDLCGGRVIAHTPEEVVAVSRFIEDTFSIDRKNSQDVSERLGASEFGYRSVHYILSFPSQSFNAHGVKLEIPESVGPLKGEVQVRTLLEHAWADFSHDRFYKNSFEVPDRWKRELAVIAASLESADRSFSRIHSGLGAYASSYGAYMSDDEIDAEIAIQEAVLEYDPGNAGLAARIGKLAITRERFDKAIEVLTPFVESGDHDVLRDLGVAICKRHGEDKRGAEYRRGQRYLEQAVDSPVPDVDAFCSLAGSWRGIEGGEDKVREYYRRGFEIDPTDPYPVGNYLEREIIHRKDVSFGLALRPVIEAAIERCRLQAEVGMNLPWAYSDMAKFHLLLGRPYEALAGYAKAIDLSSAEFMVKPSDDSLYQQDFALEQLEGLEWASRLRLLARATKFGSQAALGELRSRVSPERKEDIVGPVVFLAGGTDSAVEEQMQGYRALLVEAFRGFEGVLISGGTAAGISALAGDLGEAYPGLRTIGYLPDPLPANATADGVPDRYRELRYVHGPGEGFSALEPLQSWTDLVASGIDPADVRVVGVGGGKISGAEFRIALALGALVGLLEGSDGEAAKLLSDSDWEDSPRLVRVAADAEALRTFIAG